MFAFWWVLHENAEMSEIVDRFPMPDARWMGRGIQRIGPQGTDIVVLHNSIEESVRRKGYLDDSDICHEWGDINVLR